jgi:hypothetical protein
VLSQDCRLLQRASVDCRAVDEDPALHRILSLALFNYRKGRQLQPPDSLSAPAQHIRLLFLGLILKAIFSYMDADQ